MSDGRRLTRPVSDRWIAGVCSGIANFLGWDVGTVRLVYFLLTAGTAFSGGLVCIILWICMPSE